MQRRPDQKSCRDTPNPSFLGKVMLCDHHIMGKLSFCCCLQRSCCCQSPATAPEGIGMKTNESTSTVQNRWIPSRMFEGIHADVNDLYLKETHTHTHANSGFSLQCLSTRLLQDATVQEKTNRTPRRGRQIFVVLWIPCLTSASCMSTAGRGATTPSGCTRWCPARSRRGAGEVMRGLMRSTRRKALQERLCEEFWTC